MVETKTQKLDACCQYGCDVDIAEREQILAHSEGIRALLRSEAKDARWFDPEETLDSEYPSGRVVRTELFEGGCVFLAHDLRGCAIHRASIEGAWDMRGVKPAICRLFPLTYEGDTILIAEEYPEFSCSLTLGPTLYRLTRETLGELFGADLIRALDDAEQRVLAARIPAEVG
jgi:Fe-S-cluster containining protein